MLAAVRWTRGLYQMLPSSILRCSGELFRKLAMPTGWPVVWSMTQKDRVLGFSLFCRHQVRKSSRVLKGPAGM